MRRALIGFVALVVGTLPARPSAGLSCLAKDKAVEFGAEAILSRGVGEGFVSFNGALKVLAKSAPDDFRAVTFESEHLTQRWMHGRDLKLRLYREREGDALHGFVELVVEARNRGDDPEFRGSYTLTVFHLRSAEDSEGATLKTRGRVACSVG